MDAAKYFAKKADSGRGKDAKGRESSWMSLGEMQLDTNRLWAGDPLSGISDPGFGAVITRIESGRFVIEIKGIEYSGRRYVSRLRARLKRARSYALGEKTGTLLVDSGVAAITDVGQIGRLVARKTISTDELHDIMLQLVQDFAGVGWFKNGKEKVDVAFVACGFGDGDYPVFTLRSKRSIIGVELEFVRPDGAR